MDIGHATGLFSVTNLSHLSCKDRIPIASSSGALFKSACLLIMD